MTTHADLIDRLKAGPGSRELSDEVLVACGWLHFSPWGESPWWEAPDSAAYAEGQQPDPTRSIDDVVALIPDTHDWIAGAGHGWIWPKRGLAKGFRIDATTTALALCEALLLLANRRPTSPQPAAHGPSSALLYWVAEHIGLDCRNHRPAAGPFDITVLYSSISSMCDHCGAPVPEVGGGCRCRSPWGRFKRAIGR